ncbi:MAG: carboxypeptidase-like regulatory domain-containing protein, partial [Dysgonamonadaceae bacterium]|nr:carboxypeptidase-like regulatory domain-containing protein [Dysgonamonadaceae bacterium]
MTKVLCFLQRNYHFAALTLFILLESVSFSLSAQENIPIQGKVLDRRNGEPLIGVNILVKGLKTGTVTNVDGEFRLNLSSLPVTLSIAYAGYKPEEIDIYEKPAEAISVSLAENVLNEVVVVGYGTQKKTDLTGALSRISETQIREQPVQNII